LRWFINKKKNFKYDQIPFNMKGIVSVYTQSLKLMGKRFIVYITVSYTNKYISKSISNGILFDIKSIRKV